MNYYVFVCNGDMYWYKDANMKTLHREDGPAVEYSDGFKEWWINGDLHRDDGPAVEYTNGKYLWREWYINGQLHREDGPAIEYDDGSAWWYKNGKLHRTDGPAVIDAAGAEWFIDGKRLTEEEFKEATRPVVELTVADIEKLLGKKIKIVK